MKLKTLLALLAIAGVVYAITLSKRMTGLKEGDRAPSFTLPSRQEGISLEQFRGKVVLLNFWATWCPPCVGEMPSLDRLRKRLEGRGLEVLAVSVDEEGWKEIDRFLSKMPIGIRILLDPRGDVPILYGTTVLPETFLINQDGVIVKRYTGPQDWDDEKLVAEIEKFLRAQQDLNPQPRGSKPRALSS